VVGTGAKPPGAVGQELSGTIMYSGTRAQVSVSQPIQIFLFALTPNMEQVDFAYVSVNGGSFVLHAPAAGQYGLFYSVDTHDYRDETGSVGAPFEIYNNCYQFKYPAPPPCADLISPPQAVLSLIFDDTAVLSGIAGTVTYTGIQHDPRRGPFVQAYSNSAFSGEPEFEYGPAQTNGRYELITLDPGTSHYLRAFVDLNRNDRLDPGEPVGTCSDAVVAGPDQTDVTITFGDAGAATCIVPASPTPTPTPTPSPTPPTCVGDCGNDGSVTVDELLTMVNIALGNANVSACAPGDTNDDGQITIDEILTAVNNALNGCPGR
jgi:hypothetical protein